MNTGVSNNLAFGIIPKKFVPKSIRIEFFRDMAVWEVHTWRKTKYTNEGTQMKLIKLPIKIKGNVALLTPRATRDLNMQYA